MRRLPVYLLLDVSGSMRGTPIDSVNKGIELLVSALRRDPYALETVFLSVIPFNNTVEQTVPLTEIYKFRPPLLEAKLGTYVGKALRYLDQKVEEEVVKSTEELKGDWRPLVFMMTDGRSGDKISKALKDINMKKYARFVVCATGKDPNLEDLSLISKDLVQLSELSEENIKAFFSWLSSTVSTTSVSIETMNTGPEGLTYLPDVPPGLEIIKQPIN